MLRVKDIEFSDTIKVLFRIKQARGHKTVQDTIKYLQTEDMDVMFDVILESYNAAHPGAELNDDQLGDLLAEKGIGIAKIAMMYSEIVEKLTLSGLTDEETENLKKQVENLKK